ncbi:MAG: hypothetical protein CFE21_06835 [Bacteroidetes bacterium B1(2017)]|nr:MAG: hypothetical protein CFE21_06835 [Bacteroidetes bacterium B1(2017)]
MVSILFSCKKTEVKDELLDLGYSYYPLDSGWVKMYSVDSISFNDNTGKIDTFQFLLLEENNGLISAQGLNQHVEITRKVLFKNSLVWEPRTSLFAIQTNSNLQVVSDNIRLVKIVFPIGSVLNWNGNQYTNLGKRTFFMQNLGFSFSNQDTVFNNCIQVQEALANNAIEEVLIRSVYCKGIGLVDFVNNNLNTQSSGKSGYLVHQKLVFYKRP